MVTAGRRELTALRLTAQAIGSDGGGARTPLSPTAVVQHMLAIQAQDYSGALWSIGLRSPGATHLTVERAIPDRHIVRSWPMRGTLHFVAAQDLGWMLRISAARQATWSAKRRSDLAISDRELHAARDIATGLVSGQLVRRDTLLAAFEAAGIPTTAQRGYHLLWNLAHDGLIVHGPVDGTQPTFALLEEWVTNPTQLEGDEALGEFARRYFASHGPATERDFAWWASITLGDARRGIAIATPQSRTIDGTTYYLAPGCEPARPAVHALPGFDEFMLGYQDRSAGLDTRFAQLIVPGLNGIFLPTIVSNGQVVGTWKRVTSARRMTVDTIGFEPLAARVSSGFAKAMKRYAQFWGIEVVVRD